MGTQLTVTQGLPDDQTLGQLMQVGSQVTLAIAGLELTREELRYLIEDGNMGTVQEAVTRAVVNLVTPRLVVRQCKFGIDPDERVEQVAERIHLRVQYGETDEVRVGLQPGEITDQFPRKSNARYWLVQVKTPNYFVASTPYLLMKRGYHPVPLVDALCLIAHNELEAAQRSGCLYVYGSTTDPESYQALVVRWEYYVSHQLYPTLSRRHGQEVIESNSWILCQSE